MKKWIRTLMLIWLLVVFTLWMPGERIGELDGIYLPQSLVVSGNRAIVAQKSTFFVFGLEDGEKITRFCEEGEGPGELKFVPMIPTTIQARDDGFVAEGMNKIILYSQTDFKISFEKKKGGMAWNFQPFGDDFLCTRFVPRSGDDIDIKLVLVDENLEEVSVFHSQSTVDRDREVIMLRDPIGFGVSDGHLYVEKSDLGFVIDVYDRHGEKIRRIQKTDVTSPEVSPEFKRCLMEALRNDALVMGIANREGGWDNFVKKTTFTFPPSLPVIRDLRVKNGRVHVMAHTGEYSSARLIVMDTTGDILHTRRVPFPPSPFFTANALGKTIQLWDVDDARYYYLEMDEDSEIWFLSRIRL